MSKIKAVTYEESRLEFFKNAVEHLERRLKYWTSPKRIYDRSWYEVDEACADIGKKMSYIKDAIEALEGNGNPSFSEMLDVIMELFGGEKPCNFNNMGERCDEWCEKYCGTVPVKECWEHAVLNGWWKND